MKRASTLLITALLLGACDDSPTAPPEATSIQIQVGGAPAAEQLIEVGQSIQLTATVAMSGGGATSPVSWRSTNSGVASVDQNGVVTGVAPGDALIIASADRVADTVQVRVTRPPAAEVTCGPEAARLTLATGQVHQVQANQAPLLCLEGGGAGAEFALIPYFASPTGSIQIEVLAGGIAAPVLPIFPSVSPTRSGAGALAGGAANPHQHENLQFHLRLRELERSLLRSRPRLGPGPQLSVARAAVPAVGDLIQLNARTEACTNPQFRTARVEAVSQRAIIASDTSNPSGGFNREDFAEFAREIDELVWPVVTRNFGTPSDVDVNGRFIVFFTRAVNELTEPGSGSYVGGFYHPRDLFERTGTDACAGSNVAEVLYQLVPDTARARLNNEQFLQKGEVQRRTLAVIAHELQHLVNASRRLFEHDAPMETVWLNEALSHVAEELLFHEHGGLGPEQNITLNDLRASQARLDAVNRHQISNIGRFISFLESPSSFNLADGNDVVTRGGSWSFLRYAADRAAAPADQRQIWFNLVNTREVGINNVARVFNITPFDWFQDWSVAVLLDDTGLSGDPRFDMPSWNFRSVVPALFQEPRWPLLTRTLADGIPQTETLRAGAPAYLRFAVPAGGTGGVRVTSSRTSPPESLRLSIVRTR